MTLTLEAVASAAAIVRRRWPASQALDLLEMLDPENDPAGGMLLLEMVLYCDATPLDPVTLLPFNEDPLDPPPRSTRHTRRPIPTRLPGAGTRGIPVELARIRSSLGLDEAVPA